MQTCRLVCRLLDSASLAQTCGATVPRGRMVQLFPAPCEGRKNTIETRFPRDGA